MYPQHGVLSTLQLCLYFATKQRSRIENETDRILHPLYYFRLLCEDGRKNKFGHWLSDYKHNCKSSFVSILHAYNTLYSWECSCKDCTFHFFLQLKRKTKKKMSLKKRKSLSDIEWTTQKQTTLLQASKDDKNAIDLRFSSYMAVDICCVWVELQQLKKVAGDSRAERRREMLIAPTTTTVIPTASVC